MMVFVEGGKLKNPEKNPRSKASENQQQTQSANDTELELKPGHIGWRLALSPQCTTIPAPLYTFQSSRNNFIKRKTDVV